MLTDTTKLIRKDPIIKVSMVDPIESLSYEAA